MTSTRLAHTPEIGEEKRAMDKQVKVYTVISSKAALYISIAWVLVTIIQVAATIPL